MDSENEQDEEDKVDSFSSADMTHTTSYARDKPGDDVSENDCRSDMPYMGEMTMSAESMEHTSIRTCSNMEVDTKFLKLLPHKNHDDYDDPLEPPLKIVRTSPTSPRRKCATQNITDDRVDSPGRLIDSNGQNNIGVKHIQEDGHDTPDNLSDNSGITTESSAETLPRSQSEEGNGQPVPAQSTEASVTNCANSSNTETKENSDSDRNSIKELEEMKTTTSHDKESNNITSTNEDKVQEDAAPLVPGVTNEEHTHLADGVSDTPPAVIRKKKQRKV